jgi:hypothetical protein
MPRLVAPLPDFLRRVQNAIHRPRRAEIGLFLEQRRLDFRRRLIEEPLAVQDVEHRWRSAGTGARDDGARGAGTDTKAGCRRR